MANFYVINNFPLITAITKANPGEVTTESAHGLTTGDLVVIAGVGGMTQVNLARFTVTVTSTTTFTIGVDSTSYTTYTSGGAVYKGPGSGTYRGPWVASIAFAAGDRCTTQAASGSTQGIVFECTTAGTSGATQPAFAYPNGSTNSDNTVVWTTRWCNTWANATTTYSRLLLEITNGDTVFISHDSIEGIGTGTLKESSSSLISSDATSGEPPKALAGALFRATGAVTGRLWQNSGVFSGYVWGVTFAVGSGTDNGSLQMANRGCKATFENCRFELRGNNASSRLTMLSISDLSNRMLFRNCVFKFTNAAQRFLVGAGVQIEGGSISSDSAALTLPFQYDVSSAYSTQGLTCSVSGLDLSVISVSASLFTYSYTYFAGPILIRNCRLPTSFSGVLLTGTLPAMGRLDLQNCDGADTNYRVEIRDMPGTLVQDTGIYRTGGATDGVTPLSWKMVTSSGTNTNWLYSPLRTSEIVRWNETTGSAITVTVETLTDGVTLTDEQAWLEIMYLGTSGFPLGTWTSDMRVMTATGTASNQPTSSSGWTSPGIASPVKQKLEVTFTPQEKGFIHARVAVGRISTTIYVDPKLTIS